MADEPIPSPSQSVSSQVPAAVQEPRAGTGITVAPKGPGVGADQSTEGAATSRGAVAGWLRRALRRIGVMRQRESGAKVADPTLAALEKPVPPPVPSGSSTAEKNGAAEASPAVPLSSWLLNFGAQIAFGLSVGVVLLLLLWAFGMESRVALGTSVVVAIVATSFARSFVRWPLPKSALAARMQLPPGVRPSDSSGREVVETVVFVVVLVLLLKSFAAEAFVIPTGSMAETLLGYQKMVTCPSCGHKFPVNCSSEVEPQEDRPRVPVNGCTCPNCRQLIRLVDKDRREGRPPRSGPQNDVDGDRGVVEYREIEDPGWSSGDRVLVGKFFDAARALMPHRLSVVVFKYPKGPQKAQVAMNYIKRLTGLPGETIAVCGGNLYFLSPARSPRYDDSGVPPKKLWQADHMHANDEQAVKLFTTGAFEIVRKPPEVVLAMMRLVYDNDHQADDLQGTEWQRWYPRSDAWEVLENGKGFRHGTREGTPGADWLHYRHRLRGNAGRDTLITDFMGYNSGENLQWDPLQNRWDGRGADRNGVNWVGDLILECEVTIDKPEGNLILQLVRGGEIFQAAWDLSSDKGLCTLSRQPAKGAREELERKPTKLRKGKYRLRFANVDQRLTVWVDNELPFGDGVAYNVAQPWTVSPEPADLRPASIGVESGSLSVRKVKLFRDTYYTRKANLGDVDVSDWSDPRAWGDLKNLPVLTLYVQPGHYLCMGDNSLASSDGRDWGLVPERLMLGRALLVYYPFSRAGRIR